MSAEVLKLCLAFVLEIVTSSQSKMGTETMRRSWSTLERMLGLNRESVKLIIPAALYLLQNNLLFLALSHLSVPTYQISSQGKLLATAIFSRVLLKKRLSAMQYCAITLLGLGVAVVQLSEYRINMSAESASGGAGEPQDQWLGLLAVLVSCLTSGFAGVYFELVLKSNKQSVHYHNFQLAFWSILFAVVLIICKDMAQVKSHGLFHGFDEIVVLIVVTQTMTGFAVSMMLKYANALLKGFAISVAAIVASVASVFLFDAKVDGLFFVGASMVGIAVKMYSGKYHQDYTGQRQSYCSRPNKASFTSKILLVFALLLFASSVSQCMIVSQISTEGSENYTPAIVTFTSDLPANKLFFTAVTHETFRVPTDMQYVSEQTGYTDKGFKGGKVKCMRTYRDIKRRGKAENCAPTLDVLAWLMEQVNAKEGALIIAYGELIHIHREKDFVNATTGKYIDDDIDLWASLETVVHVGQLEPVLFRKFGWTVRLYVNAQGFVVYLQLMATCGLSAPRRYGKVKSSEPAIEIYPLPVVQVKSTLMAQDMWQNNRFPASMIYPPQHVSFNSSGTVHPLPLQLPREALNVMTCLYGNWTIPSQDHDSGSKTCATTS
jgi:UDP-sugar transporter A1/2/3